MCGGKSESLLFSYIMTFSVVLSKLTEAYYKFLSLDIGSYDRNTDGGIFANLNSRKAFKSGKFGIPNDRNPPRTHLLTPKVVTV
jgi:hypothetical protein